MKQSEKENPLAKTNALLTTIVVLLIIGLILNIITQSMVVDVLHVEKAGFNLVLDTMHSMRVY